MPFPLGGERPKSSESFWPGEKEARRLLVAVGVGGGEFSLLDIWKNDGSDVMKKVLEILDCLVVGLMYE